MIPVAIVLILLVVLVATESGTGPTEPPEN